MLCLFSFFIGNYVNLFLSNEDYIMNIMKSSNNYKKYESKNIISKLTGQIFNTNLKKPSSLIKNTFNYNYDEEYNPDILKDISKHIKDPNKVSVDNPSVYIYNTHQLENYAGSNNEVHNITPNVMMASYLLKEKLNNKNINTIVEENNFNEFLKVNSWDYSQSYEVSRYHVLEAQKRYKSLNYFIDLHRDSISYNLSTTEINQKKYAKVLFVVGLEHAGFEKNLELVNKINNIIETKYPSLSKGIDHIEVTAINTSCFQRFDDIRSMLM